jgi:hypothetical protein
MSTADPSAFLDQLSEVARELAPEQRLELIESLTAVGPTESSSPTDPAQLREAWERYHEPAGVNVGDLVVWKAGLRSRRLPQYGQPAIVHEVLEEPLVNRREPVDSPYFMERLDVVVGVLDGEGDLVFVFLDSHRLTRAAD